MQFQIKTLIFAILSLLFSKIFAIPLPNPNPDTLAAARNPIGGRSLLKSEITPRDEEFTPYGREELTTGGRGGYNKRGLNEPNGRKGYDRREELTPDGRGGYNRRDELTPDGRGGYNRRDELTPDGRGGYNRYVRDGTIVPAGRGGYQHK